MGNLTIIRKRYIPFEEVDISGDSILVNTKDTLVTKWFPINPRNDIAGGISYVDLNDNYKISRFYDCDGNFLFWYCDIIEVEITKQGENIKYLLTDLLIDVIIYPDGHYEIKDIDELEEAFEKKLINERQYDKAIFAMNRLVDNIRKGSFPPEKFNYREYEKGRADLHIHSTFSDGTFTPSQIVDMAKEMGLRAISITDHDSIDGITEADMAAAKAGIEFIPGVEFSASSIHILGYFPVGGIEKLTEVFEKYLESRRIRAKKTAQILTGLNMPVTYEDIVEEAGGDRFIGRVHFARLLLKKGYVSSTKEAFRRFLGDKRPGYVKKKGYSACEIVRKIKEYGGVAVLAHPKQLKMGTVKKEEFIKELVTCGLMGIEVYYSDNTVSETKESKELAKKYNLIMTGGSDFHGDNKPGIKLGKAKGNLVVPYECVTNLKNSLK